MLRKCYICYFLSHQSLLLLLNHNVKGMCKCLRAIKSTLSLRTSFKHKAPDIKLDEFNYHQQYLLLPFHLVYYS